MQLARMHFARQDVCGRGCRPSQTAMSCTRCSFHQGRRLYNTRAAHADLHNQQLLLALATHDENFRGHSGLDREASPFGRQPVAGPAARMLRATVQSEGEAADEPDWPGLLVLRFGTAAASRGVRHPACAALDSHDATASTSLVKLASHQGGEKSASRHRSNAVATGANWAQKPSATLHNFATQLLMCRINKSTMQCASWQVEVAGSIRGESVVHTLDLEDPSRAESAARTGRPYDHL